MIRFLRNTELTTDAQRAHTQLNVVAEMERRYKLMSAVGVRNLSGFNHKVAEAEKQGRKLDDPLSLDAALERLLPRDDRYAHRHGSVGHGGDHLLPVFVAPTLTLLVEDGRLVLGTWQSIVLVDPNRENDVRRVRLTYIEG